VIALADLLVWVVDPQKYADGAWHERYLRPLAAYADTMAVVLNQADLLAPDAVEACRTDLQGLLRADGLDGVGVQAISAQTGAGVEDLRREVARRVQRREAAVQRLSADVGEAAAGLAGTCAGSAGGLGRGDRDRLVAALAEAAGVPSVVRAVDRAHRRRGALATGWPVVRWVRRLRPDPLRRLRLADRAGEGQAAARPSLPAATPVQQAQVSTAARGLAKEAAGDLADPWPELVRAAATGGETRAADALSGAVAQVDLGMSRPRWWALAGLAQKALGAVLALGVLWLLALVGLGWLRLDDVVPTPEVEGIAIPTLAVIAAVAGGLLVALLARIVIAIGARRRARAADRRLRRGVGEVARELIVEPVNAELEARDAICRALSAARGTRTKGSR
jgi:predicted nucleic acid-binding protein